MARIWSSGAVMGGIELLQKRKCPVHWGDPLALTEEEPEDCQGVAEYSAYLDCDHENTVSYFGDDPVVICKHHMNYIKDTVGVCGCSWVIRYMGG